MKKPYLARIEQSLLDDAKRLKKLEGGSSTINGFIHEGLRIVIDNHLQSMSVHRKRSETLRTASG